MAEEQLMIADVYVLRNAIDGERSEHCENSGNGHRVRRRDTRAGTVSLNVPEAILQSSIALWTYVRTYQGVST
jgi:hypothetical protein